MKLGLYKVNNSLGYDRTTFYNYYDNPHKIEEMLQPLLDKDEAAIVNLEDVESIDEFAEGYNDELYDGGWWAVTIRDYEDDEVERLADAYNALTCAQKDKFLRLTGNE